MSEHYTNQVAQFFAQGGKLDQALKNYRFREGQQKMALAVADAISTGGSLVVEAGTGIGKSFAYLAPALLKKQKVIISTATKNLQQQLFDKDIPFVADLVAPTARIAILKGTGNYLCLRNLQSELKSATRLSDTVLSDLLRVQQWAQVTKDGDLNHVNGVSESAISLDLVRTDLNNCNSESCDFYGACFSRGAKLTAGESDILVINHHLVFNESFLEREGDNQHKINADLVVFDEAHSLADVLGRIGGHCLSENLIRAGMEQLTAVFKDELGDSPPFLKASESLFYAIDGFRKWLRGCGAEKLSVKALLGQKSGAAGFWGIVAAFDEVIQQSKILIGRSSRFDASAEDFAQLKNKLEEFTATEDVRYVQYVSLENNRFKFDAILHDVTEQLNKYIGEGTATVFTSATLSVNYRLDYFTKPLSLEKHPGVLIESPYDYSKQALMYIPRMLFTEPAQEARQRAFQQLCIKLIKENRGKTFVLCTSHQAVQKLGRVLSRRLSYPVLVQGQSGRQNLLKKYRILGDAVLIGTYSFWEGIDVKGKQLSNIIFDKLPFASPDDFFIQSKSEFISQQNGNPFDDILLPAAISKLRQGVGRLIRHENDLGLITIFDERLVSKAYGRYFLDSLPRMSRTRSYNKARQFLQNL